MSKDSANFFNGLIGRWLHITTSDGKTHAGILVWFEPDRFAVKDHEGKETLFFCNAVQSVIETSEPAGTWVPQRRK